jgi:hypothetical protein
MTTANRLRLVDTPSPTWRLDERTKELGRDGIARARAALRAGAAPPQAPESGFGVEAPGPQPATAA